MVKASYSYPHFLLILFSLISVHSFAPNLPARSVRSASTTRANKEYFHLAASAASVQQAAPIADPSTMKPGTAESFRGQTVLLTGASGGLGSALALQLSKAGVGTLVLTSRRKDALDQVAAECKSLSSVGLKVHILMCDLSDPKSVDDLSTKVLKACPQGVDVLINNGGVSSRSNFVDTESAVDRTVMQINFLSGAALAKAVVPAMISKGGGKIIWISSIQGLLAIPGRTSYAASKFAVQGYCDALRAELATSGVTVHVISPGYIRTNLSMSAITGDGSSHGKMDAATAKGADPVDVAVATLDSVAMDKAELLVATDFSAKIAIWLRFLFPGLLRSLLVKRFEKSLVKEKSE